jgi:hypothetical protein
MSNFLHGPPKLSRGPSVGDHCFRRQDCEQWIHCALQFIVYKRQKRVAICFNKLTGYTANLILSVIY